MAEVYLALSGELTGFRTLVVVKRILPHLVSNREFIRMFFDEARIVALLDHPNIVRLIEIGQDGDEFFLAMDLIRGKPLSALMRKAIKEGSPLSQAQSAYLVAQAANGLGHAHTLLDAGGLPLNVVHRDVSPQNILVSYEGAVKLIDFGVARAMGRVSETKPGGLKGKIHYMAPEQASSGRVDRRSDVFALGVVLWEAVVGHRPFRRETDLETLRAVVDEPVPPPSKFVKISARLESIIMRAVERKPDERFQTAQEMALALERYAYASPEFNPAQIATSMKGLFASDFSRWKNTFAAMKNLDGEPEQWTNTSGTYLRPEGINLKTRGSTLALHPVPTPRPSLASNEEMASISGSQSLPSLGLTFPGPLERRWRHRRLGLFGGAGALAVGLLVMGLLRLGHPSSTTAVVRATARESTTPSSMRVEALPAHSVSMGGVTPTTTAAVPYVEPPALKALPKLVPDSTVEAVGGDVPASITQVAPAPPPVPARRLSLPLSEKHATIRRSATARTARGAPLQTNRSKASRSSVPSNPSPSPHQSISSPRSSLDKIPKNASNQRCFVRLGTKPWAEIWIDGQNTKTHTPYSRGIACGEHKLTFKRADLGLVKSFRITAMPGDTLIESFSLQ